MLKDHLEPEDQPAEPEPDPESTEDSDDPEFSGVSQEYSISILGLSTLSTSHQG